MSWSSVNSLNPSDAYIFVGIIGADNGLSPVWCQTFSWTLAGLYLTESVGTNFSEIWVRVHQFSYKTVHLKMTSEEWWLFSSYIKPQCISVTVSGPSIQKPRRSRCARHFNTCNSRIAAICVALFSFASRTLYMKDLFVQPMCLKNIKLYTRCDIWQAAKGIRYHKILVRPHVQVKISLMLYTPSLDLVGHSCLRHDDVIKWKHFPRNWPFVRGIHRSRWIPHTKASDAELWCFLWPASE